MRSFIAGLCIAGLMLTVVVAAETTPDEASKAELARLQGKWRSTSLEISGTVTEYSGDDGPTVTVKDQTLSASTVEDATFKITLIDPTTKPKIFDVVNSKTDQTLEGIYELDGDTWRMCININALEVRERPSEFTSKNGLLIVAFKRESPEVAIA